MDSVGRPPKFRAVEELQEKIDAYFAECAENGEPLTITGLALALDTTRDVLMDYQRKDEGEPDGFSNAMKKAKLRIEHAYELRNIGRGNAGDIFALKNFGWSDRQEVKVSGGMNLTYAEYLDKVTGDEY